MIVYSLKQHVEVTISTVVLTGASGLVGSHTVEEFLRRGFKVKCIFRKGRKDFGWAKGLDIEPIYMDINNQSEAEAAFKGAEYIVHIAGVTKAKTTQEYVDGNVKPLTPLLEAAAGTAGLKKFVHISSQAAVGPSQSELPLTEDAPCNPVTAYGQSKMLGEQVVLNYLGRVPLTVLRPPTVFGPRDTDFYEVYKSLKSGLAAGVGDKEKFVSMVYVKDLARGIVDAAVAEATTGQVYFITDGGYHRLETINQIILAAMGRKALRVQIPVPLFAVIATAMELLYAFSKKPPILNRNRMRDFIQKFWLCSSEKLQRDIGFKAAYSLESALRETYDWYKQEKWL